MLKKILTIIILLLIFDFLWLGVINRDYISSKLSLINGNLNINKNRLLLLIPLYLIMGYCFYYFIYREKKSAKQIYFEVFLLSLTIFAVFDITTTNLVYHWNIYDVTKDITYGVTANLIIAFIINKYLV
jgi:hypothetical protein